jgi:hypothetical protein
MKKCEAAVVQGKLFDAKELGLGNSIGMSAPIVWEASFENSWICCGWYWREFAKQLFNVFVIVESSRAKFFEHLFRLQALQSDEDSPAIR